MPISTKLRNIIAGLTALTGSYFLTNDAIAQKAHTSPDTLTSHSTTIQPNSLTAGRTKINSLKLERARLDSLITAEEQSKVQEDSLRLKAVNDSLRVYTNFLDNFYSIDQDSLFQVKKITEDGIEVAIRNVKSATLADYFKFTGLNKKAEDLSVLDSQKKQIADLIKKQYNVSLDHNFIDLYYENGQISDIKYSKKTQTPIYGTFTTAEIDTLNLILKSIDNPKVKSYADPKTLKQEITYDDGIYGRWKKGFGDPTKPISPGTVKDSVDPKTVYIGDIKVSEQTIK